MSAARVFPFLMDGVRMRVVVRRDAQVVIERFGGTDALGVERWLDVDLHEVDDYEDPIVSADAWVSAAVLAVVGEVTP